MGHRLRYDWADEAQGIYFVAEDSSQGGRSGLQQARRGAVTRSKLNEALEQNADFSN
jgi:hypothetical protein